MTLWCKYNLALQKSVTVYLISTAESVTRFLLVFRCNGIILRLSTTITLELFKGLVDFIHLQSEQECTLLNRHQTRNRYWRRYEQSIPSYIFFLYIKSLLVRSLSLYNGLWLHHHWFLFVSFFGGYKKCQSVTWTSNRSRPCLWLSFYARFTLFEKIQSTVKHVIFFIPLWIYQHHNTSEFMIKRQTLKIGFLNPFCKDNHAKTGMRRSPPQENLNTKEWKSSYWLVYTRSRNLWLTICSPMKNLQWESDEKVWISLTKNLWWTTFNCKLIFSIFYGQKWVISISTLGNIWTSNIYQKMKKMTPVQFDLSISRSVVRHFIHCQLMFHTNNFCSIQKQHEMTGVAIYKIVHQRFLIRPSTFAMCSKYTNMHLLCALLCPLCLPQRSNL